MKRFSLPQIERHYTNNGQHAEQVYRFAMTGEICKADNLPHNLGADCGLTQIKGARATVCKGLDLSAYLDADKAETYAYVSEDFKTAYLMERAEWEQFCTAFGTVTRESDKNGGGAKIRLKQENKKMREWLERA